MSVDGETLSAITGVEEACATARARVEDLVAELDDLRRCLRSVIAQRDEAHAVLDRIAAAVGSSRASLCVKLAGLPAWQQACEQSRRDLAHAEAEVDRLRKDSDSAYRRGAEAMRVEVMQYLVRQQNEATVMVVDTAIKGVHTLPIPEEP